MKTWITLFLSIFFLVSQGQTTLSGTVIDAETGAPVFAANVFEDGTTNGTITDFDGKFSIAVAELPATLKASYLGYEIKITTVTSASQTLIIKLSPNAVALTGAEIVGSRISDKQKQEPLTVETMDVIAIKEAPSGNLSRR